MVKIDIWRIDKELRDHIFQVVGLFAPDFLLEAQKLKFCKLAKRGFPKKRKGAIGLGAHMIELSGNPSRRASARVPCASWEPTISGAKAGGKGIVERRRAVLWQRKFRKLTAPAPKNPSGETGASPECGRPGPNRISQKSASTSPAPRPRLRRERFPASCRCARRDRGHGAGRSGQCR